MLKASDCQPCFGGTCSIVSVYELFFGARVGLVVDLGQMLIVQMGIDLGGGQIRMPQQFLYRPKIARGLQNVGGEGVA